MPDLVVGRPGPLPFRRETRFWQTRHGRHSEEAEDRVAHLLGVGDQVLVPHPERTLAEAFLNPQDQRHVGRPELGQRQHRVAGRTIRIRVEPEAVEPPGARLDSGGDHIHGMPVQAQELRIGEDGPEHVSVLRRAEALIAVAPLPPPLKVWRDHLIHGVPDPGQRGVGDGRRLTHPLGRKRRAFELRPDAGDLRTHRRQPGLGRAGQVGVRIEQEPQQGRSGPARTEHEYRLSARQGWLQGGGQHQARGRPGRPADQGRTPLSGLRAGAGRLGALPGRSCTGAGR